MKNSEVASIILEGTNLFHKALFILAHECIDASFYPTFKNLLKNQWRPFEEQKLDQEKLLRNMINYSYEYVPYYRNLFKNLNLLPKDIRTIEDLEKLPILTKDTIKLHYEEFKPVTLSSQKYSTQATGGSTGTPMQYRISKKDRFLGGAQMYRGWNNGGFNLGDRMIFLGGSSLNIGAKPQIEKKVHDVVRNIRQLSAFDMGEIEMKKYVNIFSEFQPLFLRGYASSIYFFACWLEKNDITVPPLNAVFTTAEKLFPKMRETVGRVFECEVFDGYGMNDGGLNAVECSAHSGLHIDTERSIMEVVDSNSHQIVKGQGEILATSLHNFAMPFIRYSPGDLATLLDDDCSCGRHQRVLKDIVGREKELLISPSGRIVHGAALIGLIYIVLESSAFPGVVNRIRQYQIVQKVKEIIEVRLVCDSPLPDEVLNYIQQLVSERFDGWHMKFIYVDAIDQTRAGKYKFIINELNVNA